MKSTRRIQGSYAEPMDVVVVWDMSRLVDELGVNSPITGDTGAGNGASKVRKTENGSTGHHAGTGRL